jgi:hypothetical protein
MSAQTPGPWSRDNFGNLIDSDGHSILFRGVAMVTSGPRVSEGEANSTLISAAPDLLAALRAMLVGTNRNPNYLHTIAIPSAIAAIAKANGETK